MFSSYFLPPFFPISKLVCFWKSSDSAIQIRSRVMVTEMALVIAVNLACWQIQANTGDVYYFCLGTWAGRIQLQK
jgi:hypothetical protein